MYLAHLEEQRGLPPAVRGWWSWNPAALLIALAPTLEGPLNATASGEPTVVLLLSLSHTGSGLLYSRGTGTWGLSQHQTRPQTLQRQTPGALMAGVLPVEVIPFAGLGGRY